ncbi:MAG: hypothetical protein WCP22_11165 [Chlamydiota bacterium]
MDINQLLEAIPLWGIYGCSVAMVLLSIQCGIWIGRHRRNRSGQDQDSPLGAAVGATLGLLAFMLAFTFGMTASRFDARKQLLLDEVNAIETTFLRAGLLPEPHRTEVRTLLAQYADIRANIVMRPERLPQLIRDSEELHGRLWPHAEALADANLKNPDIVSLFVDSLNEMIDLHTDRVTVAFYRIPTAIWIALWGVTILSMVAVGYHFGESGKGNWHLSLLLSLTFSAVILLIADLDRTGSGAIMVSQQPMINLREKLKERMK